MTAAGTALRLAAGGGLHASLLLLIPFSISSAASPLRVFTFLTTTYVTLLLLTTTTGLLALLFTREEKTGESSRTRSIKITSSTASALIYTSLPATLIQTEGITKEVVSISAVAFALGFIFHYFFLSITFSKISRKVFMFCALFAPILLILTISISAAP